MAKKILHVITNFSALGGAEMMLQKLILAQPEYQHYIVSLIGVSDIYRESIEKTKYTKALNWRAVNTVRTILYLKKEIEKINPDVIQTWMYHANFMVSISNFLCKTQYPIYWGIHHSLNSIAQESLSTKIAIYLNRFFAQKVKGIIYCAQSSLEQHKIFGFKNDNQVFIPNGLNLETFRFIEREFNNPIRIGFVGRNHKAKGLPYLFEIMSYFKDDMRVEFKVAGTGLSHSNEDIQLLVRKFKIGNNVALLDSVTKMESFYHNIDILLMTSITEGFPNVLIEAMATGAICIATDVGDISYILDKNGFVGKVECSDDLISHIEKYIELSVMEKKRKSKEASYLTLERFDINIIANKYMEIWNSEESI